MNRSRGIFLAILLILVAVAMFVAVFVLVRENSSSGSLVLPTQISTSTPTATPTPTPTPPLYMMDTDGGGLDDFNEIYVYGMDPYNAADDAGFLSSIPDVQAEYMIYDAGKLNHTLGYIPQIMEYSSRDPFIQWVASNTQVCFYSTDMIGGELNIVWDGEFLSVFGEWIDYNLSNIMTPAYYFSHGMNGKCADSSAAVGVVLVIKGWDCEFILGVTPEGEHAWLEVSYLGDLYVVNFNDIVLASDWYADHTDWSINYRQDFD